MSVGNAELAGEIHLLLLGTVEPRSEAVATVNVAHEAQDIACRATCQAGKLLREQFYVTYCGTKGLPIATNAAAAVGFPPVTVSAAFQAALARFLRLPEVSSKRRLSDASGLAASYIGRLADGSMENPTLTAVEQVRTGLSALLGHEVPAAALFDPESTANRHQPVRSDTDARLPQQLSVPPEGGPLSQFSNNELILLGYCRKLADEHQQELIDHAHRLSQTSNPDVEKSRTGKG